MKSILIIIPYFGPFPKEFKFWLQSAYNNPSVNFLIITDNNLAAERNVDVLHMQFEELVSLIQSKFDFEISLPTPYKLCDYKVAYAYIFSDHVKEFDFWGFGDIDLVYGDIRHFLTEQVMAKYKMLLGWGHLTLYKNCGECNTFFQEQIEGFTDYVYTFSRPQYSHYDEFWHKGVSDKWKYKHPETIWEEKPFDDIMVPRLSINFNSVFNNRVSRHLIFEYVEGNLYRVFVNEKNEIVKEATLYAHFQQRKFMRVKTNNTNSYLIIPNAYIGHSPISKFLLKIWTRPQHLNRHYRNLRSKIVRRLSQLN